MAVAVDVMGGDYPVTVPIDGAIRAANDFDIKVVLVGDESKIRAQLQKHSYKQDNVSVVHCSEVVEMHESPALALRQKKKSSIRVAIELHKQGEVDAVISAGNTGAAMATAKFVLKSIKGIDRPAISTLMPSLENVFVMLDVGANTDCKPHYLLQFALMGDAYARCLLHMNNPKVALLNNGEEEGKGNALLKATYHLLKESTLNFSGNLEGKAMFMGEADIIVCDGFVGNISLKVAEGTFELISNLLKEEIKRSTLAKIGYLAMRGPFRELKRRADYTEVGGAPLLGVQGTVIICHGNANALSIRNAVKHASECAELHLNDMIAKEVADNLKLLKQAETIEIPESAD